MRHYLDNAATTPVRPAAKAAMVAALDVFGNPSSVHHEGQQARVIVDGARKAVGDLLGVRSERVVFTSGGTEANNLALRALAGQGRLLCSAVEHDCVLNTVRALKGDTLPVDAQGRVALPALEAALRTGQVAVVSVMWVNNETGVIQPVEDVVRLAHENGVLVHVDAVQAVGHVPVDVDALGADLVSLSAHKFGGPKGVGALVVRPEVQSRMTAQLTGGAQERNRRAGTENVVGLAGLKATVEAMDVQAEARHMGMLLSQLSAGLAGLPVRLVAPTAAKAPHILQLLTPGRKGEDMVIGLDLKGIAASQGSACSSGRVQSSHVLQAMGHSVEEAGQGLRLSLGWASTQNDVDAALSALRGLLNG
jgi:cysteine desulfurase